jgi:hypothetical protein
MTSLNLRHERGLFDEFLSLLLACSVAESLPVVLWADALQPRRTSPHHLFRAEAATLRNPFGRRRVSTSNRLATLTLDRTCGRHAGCLAIAEWEDAHVRPAEGRDDHIYKAASRINAPTTPSRTRISFQSAHILHIKCTRFGARVAVVIRPKWVAPGGPALNGILL